jgi:hypothetical protein
MPPVAEISATLRIDKLSPRYGSMIRPAHSQDIQWSLL